MGGAYVCLGPSRPLAMCTPQHPLMGSTITKVDPFLGLVAGFVKIIGTDSPSGPSGIQNGPLVALCSSIPLMEWERASRTFSPIFLPSI